MYPTTSRLDPEHESNTPVSLLARPASGRVPLQSQSREWPPYTLQDNQPRSQAVLPSTSFEADLEEVVPRISSQSHHTDTDNDRDASPEGSSSHKRARRDKAPIPLDPSQPLTTRGKPRARVYVACQQCRNRKIRCDGAKPACHNCTVKGVSECNYDPIPRRRGPDKKPGARQRPGADAPSQPRRRVAANADPYPVSSVRRSSVGDLDLQPNPSTSQAARTDHLYFEEYDIPSQQAYSIPQGYSNLRADPTDLAAHHHGAYPYSQQNIHGYDSATRPIYNSFLAQPSMQFSRSTCQLYAADIRFPARMGTQQITEDLRFMFRVSNYWFSFFHVPTFFGTFHNAYGRDNMQPGLVYGALAISIFFRSSQLEGKEMGRERALRFRDMAQGYIDAAFNTQCVDVELAQAAWLAALFEVCAHPLHSTPRCASALRILDAIIQSLRLTSIDFDNPRTSMFTQSSVPLVRSPTSTRVGRRVWCTHNCTGPDDYVPPTWEMTPAWNPAWSDVEIERESSRRLVWSSLFLFSGHHTYNLSYGKPPVALHISAPSNYAVLFTGESSIYTMRPDQAPRAKDTVWALFERSFLLWNAAILMVMRTRSPLTKMSDVEKAHFAISVNQEADVIENALRAHTCDIERAFLFQSRDYLFSARMCVGYEYRRVLPATSVFYGTEDMLKKMSYRIAIGRQVMQGLHTVTGNASNTLNRRPFFVFWFMAQIKSAIRLYKSTDLLMALELCKALMPCVDYLSTLFPCPEQRNRYAALVYEVNEACAEHGQPLYERLDFTSVMSNPNQSSARLTTYAE
ncbi:hypothetical protein BD626DRAFT_568626 [Schizophyllum amplum]|uniref:Zn(2)-C6 fungal-type domain-containing protein n=1 Tax=Schizophyllum amplum TaxID=97359 RepID=A0A550CH46_9AGAR|nr:hypothetical protein BD626DRAFT_568626 [Auriculariopsis ampla]